MRVAGLAKVEGIHGLENIDVTSLVNGHMAYRAAMPRLLREVGWQVESDEFHEIEDPDPENHEKRQRELIRELDEARKDAEAKPEKKRFGFFKRGKLAEKKRWETYDERARDDGGSDAGGADGGSGNVLFDIEAIKKELASEMIEVRQLESTLPPMQLSLNETNPSTDNNLQNQHSYLRESKSYDASMTLRPKSDAGGSQTSLPIRRPSNPFAHFDDNNSHRDSKSYNSSCQNVSMSFESAPQSPSRSPRLFADQEPAETRPAPYLHEPTSHSEPTMPAAVPSLEHNAWLEEEDENFGKEQQITMSFA